MPHRSVQVEGGIPISCFGGGEEDGKKGRGGIYFNNQSFLIYDYDDRRGDIPLHVSVGGQ